MCNSWYNQKQQTVNCKREANEGVASVCSY